MASTIRKVEAMNTDLPPLTDQAKKSNLIACLKMIIPILKDSPNIFKDGYENDFIINSLEEGHKLLVLEQLKE